MKNGFKYLNDICNTSYMPTNIAKQNAWELNHDQKTKIFKRISKKKKSFVQKVFAQILEIPVSYRKNINQKRKKN